MKNRQAPLAQLAEQLTLNQWVLGSSPRGRTSKKIPLILRNRRDFCVPSEKILLGLRYRYFPLLWCSMLGRRYSPSFLQGTRPRFASDTLMSLRAIPSFSLGYLMVRRGISIPLRICGSGILGIPSGSVGVLRGFRVRPVPGELWRGRLSRFSLLLGGLAFCVWGGGGCRGLACCMVAECLGWCAVFSGSALRVSHGRSPQRSKEGRSVRVTGAPA